MLIPPSRLLIDPKTNQLDVNGNIVAMYQWMDQIYSSLGRTATFASNSNLPNPLSIPGTTLAEASQFLQVNPAGTAYELKTPAQTRTELGLGDLALENSPLSLAKGGTAAISAAAARTSLSVYSAAEVDALLAAIGATWTTPAYDAANFVGAGTLTWTVAAGDVKTYSYMIINKLMILAFALNTTTLAGGAGEVSVKLKIPASKVLNQDFDNFCVVIEGANRVVGVVGGDVGDTFLDISKNDALLLTVGVDNWYARGTALFAIQ